MTSPTIDRRQGLVGNTPIKAPVDCATTGPITLSGEQVIDGVLTDGSRVLVMNQADATQNGIYDSSTAEWTRSQDADGNYDLVLGTLLLVNGGTSNGSSVWTVNVAGPIAFGSTAISFVRALVNSAAVIGFLQAGANAVQRSLQNKARELISPADFGGDPTGVADSAAAIRAAMVVGTCDLGGAENNWTILSQLAPVDYQAIVGTGATIKVGADIVAISNQGQEVKLHGFNMLPTVAHTHSLIENGTALIRADSLSIRDVKLSGAGLHGLSVINGNRGHAHNFTSISNGGDGCHFGQASTDANAWTSSGLIDLRGNAGAGVLTEVATDPTMQSCLHELRGLVCQDNGTYGADIGTFGNILSGYFENSASGHDVRLRAAATGNEVTCTSCESPLDDGGFVNGNEILMSNVDGSKRRQPFGKQLFAGGSGKGIGFTNSDGTAGEVYAEKTTTATFTITGATTSQNWTTKYLNAAGGFYHYVQAGIVFPTQDNTHTLGTASFRWSQLYAGTATINTSDAREKQDIRSLNEKELAVGRRLRPLIKTWRWIDAVAKKGDSARIHVGWVAQEVIAAFQAEGLDAFAYGACCHDIWEETKTEHSADVDAKGNVMHPAWTEVHPAGERYGVRDAHITAFVLAAM